jgi:hypothetical protein
MVKAPMLMGITEVVVALADGARDEIDALEARLHEQLPGCLSVIGTSSHDRSHVLRLHLHPSDLDELADVLARDELGERIEAAQVVQDDEEDPLLPS